jgi:hypothetical protein
MQLIGVWMGLPARRNTMKRNRVYDAALGTLLVLAGIALFLASQGVIGPFTSTLSRTAGMILFTASGLAFLAAFVTNMHDRWSAIIFALTLLALSVLVAFVDRLGDSSGGLFLGAIGLGFVIVFLVRHEFWWALIPAGALFTLAVVASVANSAATANWVPGILFFGLAATFLAVYALPGGKGRRIWALWPAGILATVGAFVSAATSGWMQYIVPLLAIAAGVYVVLRAIGVVK